jgi:hypothetical protein
MSGRLVEPQQMRFRIVDHISGQQRDIVTNSTSERFSRDDMTASLGGPQFIETAGEGTSEPQSSPEAHE